MPPRTNENASAGRPRPAKAPPPRAASAPPRPRPRSIPGERITVEIVCAGREILRGRVFDTNSREIASTLSQRGAVVRRIVAVDDKEPAIAAAITEALVRGTRLVITSGGLGPMADDCTLVAVADALRIPLALSARAKEMVDAAYRRLHRQGLVAKVGLDAAREKMCSLPIGSEPIPNDVGTAPGVLARLAGGSGVLCLPGVPAEMRSVLEAALPLLKDLAPKGVVARREVETPTADESSLRPLLDRLCREQPAVWIKSYAPGFHAPDARIRVVLEASGADRQEAEALVEDALRRLIALAAGG